MFLCVQVVDAVGVMGDCHQWGEPSPDGDEFCNF